MLMFVLIHINNSVIVVMLAHIHSYKYILVSLSILLFGCLSVCLSVPSFSSIISVDTSAEV